MDFCKEIRLPKYALTEINGEGKRVWNKAGLDHFNDLMSEENKWTFMEMVWFINRSFKEADISLNRPVYHEGDLKHYEWTKDSFTLLVRMGHPEFYLYINGKEMEVKDLINLWNYVAHSEEDEI